MSLAPHRVRISGSLHSVLVRVGPNSSAAHRALLLLGAQAAGYDLAACRNDIGRLLGEELDEPVLHRLAALYEACRTHVGRRADIAPTSVLPSRAEAIALHPPPDTLDPLASIGIEV
jgi:hypothetical protein